MIRLIILFTIVMDLYATPSWYYNVDSLSSNYYVGYGHGESESKAKNLALGDISRQISVTVDSTVSSSVRVKDDELTDDFNNENKQTSYAKIYGYETLRFEHEEDGYYIALGYENVPSIDKFNKKISDVTIDESKPFNPYLMQTRIFRDLNKKVDFSLKRQDGIWYIRYKEIFQALDERDLSRFFVTTANPDLDIKTSRPNDVLYDGDEFYFEVASKKDGYITIFTAYEDGAVATLIRNVPVKNARVENIPDKDFESVLQAGLIESGVETFDLYVVVFSEEEKFFDDFARADEDLVTDERYKNFDELLGLLYDMEYVTLKVVTKPRS